MLVDGPCPGMPPLVADYCGGGVAQEARRGLRSLAVRLVEYRVEHVPTTVPLRASPDALSEWISPERLREIAGLRRGGGGRHDLLGRVPEQLRCVVCLTLQLEYSVQLSLLRDADQCVSVERWHRWTELTLRCHATATRDHPATAVCPASSADIWEYLLRSMPSWSAGCDRLAQLGCGSAGLFLRLPLEVLAAETCLVKDFSFPVAIVDLVAEFL